MPSVLNSQTPTIPRFLRISSTCYCTPQPTYLPIYPLCMFSLAHPGSATDDQNIPRRLLTGHAFASHASSFRFIAVLIQSTWLCLFVRRWRVRVLKRASGPSAHTAALTCRVWRGTVGICMSLTLVAYSSWSVARVVQVGAVVQLIARTYVDGTC